MNKKNHALSGILLASALVSGCDNQEETYTVQEEDLWATARQTYAQQFARTADIAQQIAKASAESAPCKTPREQDNILIATKELLMAAVEKHHHFDDYGFTANSLLDMADQLASWEKVLTPIAAKGIAVQIAPASESPVSYAYLADKNILYVQTTDEKSNVAHFKKAIEQISKSAAAQTANSETLVSWRFNNNNSGITNVPAGTAKFSPFGMGKYSIPAPLCK